MRLLLNLFLLFSAFHNLDVTAVASIWFGGLSIIMIILDDPHYTETIDGCLILQCCFVSILHLM